MSFQQKIYTEYDWEYCWLRILVDSWYINFRFQLPVIPYVLSTFVQAACLVLLCAEFHTKLNFFVNFTTQKHEFEHKSYWSYRIFMHWIFAFEIIINLTNSLVHKMIASLRVNVTIVACQPNCFHVQLYFHWMNPSWYWPSIHNSYMNVLNIQVSYLIWFRNHNHLPCNTQSNLSPWKCSTTIVNNCEMLSIPQEKSVHSILPFQFNYTYVNLSTTVD